MRSSLLLFLLGVAALGCEPSAPRPPVPHQDLLTGYHLLADALSDESQIRYLMLLKKVTLRGPVEEVEAIARKIGAASKRRRDELEELRTLAPDVSQSPAVRSPVGDAITELAKEAGTDELLDRELSFSLRFVILQAQATRMVAAMAKATAQADPNPRRQAWLRELAAEYEGYREELIDVIELYLRGEGSAQREAD